MYLVSRLLILRRIYGRTNRNIFLKRANRTLRPHDTHILHRACCHRGHIFRCFRSRRLTLAMRIFPDRRLTGLTGTRYPFRSARLTLAMRIFPDRRPVRLNATGHPFRHVRPDIPVIPPPQFGLARRFRLGVSAPG